MYRPSPIWGFHQNLRQFENFSSKMNVVFAGSKVFLVSWENWERASGGLGRPEKATVLCDIGLRFLAKGGL